MARVKIDDIVDHLDHEMRAALQDAVHEVLPQARFDEYELFRAFQRHVYNKCALWESVPDHYVDTE